MTGYRTIIVNALMFLVYSLQWEQLAEFFDPQMLAEFALLINGVLRFFTHSPVFKK